MDTRSPMHKQAHSHTSRNAHMHEHTYTETPSQAHIDTYKHTYTHLQTHTHTRNNLFSLSLSNVPCCTPTLQPLMCIALATHTVTLSHVRLHTIHVHSTHYTPSHTVTCTPTHNTTKDHFLTTQSI